MQTTPRTPTMPRVAYSYLRFSHPSQAAGDSARRQESFAEHVCRERGWRLDDSFILRDEGCSAYRGKHRSQAGRKAHALALFLEAVKSGRVTPGSVLIVENIDRLSREQVFEAYGLFSGILTAGITIVTREPQREYSRENCNDLLSLLEPLFCMARAHEESHVKSMRVKEAWGQKKRRAAEALTPLGRWCPRWVRLGPKGYERIPQHAETVRHIFRLAREGLGVARI
jgi:DNA invertase Pin-like site-specific DNA recombinase